jgi:hypothetical protein
MEMLELLTNSYTFQPCWLTLLTTGKQCSYLKVSLTLKPILNADITVVSTSSITSFKSTVSSDDQCATVVHVIWRCLRTKFLRLTILHGHRKKKKIHLPRIVQNSIKPKVTTNMIGSKRRLESVFRILEVWKSRQSLRNSFTVIMWSDNRLCTVLHFLHKTYKYLNHKTMISIHVYIYSRV